MHNNDLNFSFDIGKDPYALGRLKLPYKSLNFLSLLYKRSGRDKYDSARDMMEICQWMYIHVSDVRNIINRLAEYIITDIQIDNSASSFSKEQQDNFLNILEKINLKPTLIRAAKQFFSVGNVITSVEVKFKKHLICPKCSTTYPINLMTYKFNVKDVTYETTCLKNSCKYKGPMKVLDSRIRKPENIYLKIWDWHDIDFDFNPISDEYKYYYKIPKDVIAGLDRKIPDAFLLNTTPDFIIQDIYKKKTKLKFAGTSDKARVVAFKQGKIKHIKNDSIMCNIMGGWGEPLTMGVLQDVFFMQLLRQAQSVILADYLIPIRIVSPDPAANNFSDIGRFAQEFDKLYEQFQRNPLQIFKVPYPIQYQTLTGEGKTLFLSNEMDYTRQAIRRGMGVPSELLDGGMQNYSAGNISIRMLENFVLNFTSAVINDLVNNFLIPNICVNLDLKPFKINFSKFKSMDDVQKNQTRLNLYDRNLLTDLDIYDSFGEKRPSDDDIISSVERKAKRDGTYQNIVGNFQGELQTNLAIRNAQTTMDIQEMTMKEQQLQANKNPQPAGPTAGSPPVDNGDTVQPTGEQLPPAEQMGESAMNQLQTPEELQAFIDVLSKNMSDNPGYVEEVSNYIMSNSPLMSSGPANEDTRPRKKDGGVDVRPDPTQKPPRRK